jgi:hypothetical protein
LQVYATCIPTGNNDIEDTVNGFLLNMDKSVEVFAAKVRADPNLKNGFNAFGLSQVRMRKEAPLGGARHFRCDVLVRKGCSLLQSLRTSAWPFSSEERLLWLLNTTCLYPYISASDLTPLACSHVHECIPNGLVRRHVSFRTTANRHRETTSSTATSSSTMIRLSSRSSQSVGSTVASLPFPTAGTCDSFFIFCTCDTPRRHLMCATHPEFLRAGWLPLSRNMLSGVRGVH